MKKSLLSIVFLFFILIQVNAQVESTKLIFDENLLSLSGHVSDTVYGNVKYFYAVAPAKGIVPIEKDNYCTVYRGGGINEKGGLISKSYFNEGDTIFFRVTNNSFGEIRFSASIIGGSLEHAIESEFSTGYAWCDAALWYATPIDVYDSVLFQILIPTETVVYEYATSSDKTIKTASTYAIIPLAETDTIYFKTNEREQYIISECSSNVSSPINSYKAHLSHNDIPEKYAEQKTFWGEFIADADTFVRIDKPSEGSYMSSNQKSLSVYINGIYTGITSCTSLIPVETNDTVLFTFSMYDEIVSNGIELNYMSDATGNSESNPLYVEDNADSILLDFSESKTLFVSSEGLVIYTKNKELEAESKQLYSDSIYQSWIQVTSRRIRRFTAPLGTEAVVYNVYRPLSSEAIAAEDTNNFENTEMFSIVRYDIPDTIGKHLWFSDGEMQNIILGNYYQYEVLSYDGDGVDLTSSDFCWLNTTGKPFVWTIDYSDRRPGLGSRFTKFNFPDTVPVPGCYQFILYTDSLAEDVYKGSYSIIYEVQEKSTIEFGFNADFKILNSYYNVNKIFNPGTVAFTIGGSSNTDTLIYCEITEHPIQAEELASVELVTDTILVGNNSEVNLDNSHNYVINYEAAQSGILYYWLEGEGGDVFKGYLNYGSYTDSSYIQIRDIGIKTIRVFNTQYQSLVFHTNFVPLAKGDFVEYKKDALLGLNSGAIMNFVTTVKYFSFKAPEDAVYFIYPEKEGTNLSQKRFDMKAGNSKDITLEFDAGVNNYAFTITKENITDTLYRELYMGLNYINETSEFHTKNRIGFTYTAMDSGQIHIPFANYGGGIYNDKMELIKSFNTNNELDVVKDSSYVIIYNSLCNTASIRFYFVQDDYGTADNPIPAHVGFNSPVTENGENIYRTFTYYSYKAEKDGYIHLVNPEYMSVDGIISFLDFKKERIPSFPCYKDSVYTFRAISSTKIEWLMSYTEQEKFIVSDSLIITDGVYNVTEVGISRLGFYVVPYNGYFSIQASDTIDISFSTKSPELVHAGEIIPIYVNLKESGIVVPVTVGLIPFAGNTALQSALYSSTVECELNDAVTFSSLSRMANFWEWDFNEDGVTDSYNKDPNFIFTLPGEYTVRLITGNCANVDTLYQTITITGECEDIMYSLGDDFTLRYGETVTLTAVDDALWSTGFSGSVLNLENFTLTDSVLTIWTTFQIDSCTISDTIKVTYLSEQLISSVVEDENHNTFVYPTRVIDHLYIETKEDQLKSVSIINLNGVCVLNQKCNSQYEAINLSHLSKGIYIVMVQTNNQIKRLKILKK